MILRIGNDFSVNIPVFWRLYLKPKVIFGLWGLGYMVALENVDLMGLLLTFAWLI